MFSLVHINKRLASLQTKIALSSGKLATYAFLISIFSLSLVVYSLVPKHNYELEELQNIKEALSIIHLEMTNTKHKQPTTHAKNEPSIDLIDCSSCHVPLININNKVRHLRLLNNYITKRSSGIKRSQGLQKISHA